MKRISLELPNSDDYKEPLLKALKNSFSKVIIDPYSRSSSKNRQNLECNNNSFNKLSNELKNDKKLIRIKKTFKTQDKSLKSVSNDIYIKEKDKIPIYHIEPFKYSFRKRKNCEVERFSLPHNIQSIQSFKTFFFPNIEKKL
jgi:hypothetical protein